MHPLKHKCAAHLVGACLDEGPQAEQASGKEGRQGQQAGPLGNAPTQKAAAAWLGGGAAQPAVHVGSKGLSFKQRGPN